MSYPTSTNAEYAMHYYCYYAELYKHMCVLYICMNLAAGEMSLFRRRSIMSWKRSINPTNDSSKSESGYVIFMSESGTKTTHSFLLVLLWTAAMCVFITTPRIEWNRGKVEVFFFSCLKRNRFFSAFSSAENCHSILLDRGNFSFFAPFQDIFLHQDNSECEIFSRGLLLIPHTAYFRAFRFACCRGFLKTTFFFFPFFFFFSRKYKMRQKRQTIFYHKK